MLFACKSTGAIIYGVMFLPVVAYVKKPRMWLQTGLALLVLLFPLVRGVDIFPTDTLVEWAGKLNEERALSLWFRFDQEDQLLDRARERIYFGWGTYNRNRVFDEETGADLSITDGDWMIQVGTRGVIGFFGLYGLLAFAVLIASRRIRTIRDKKDKILLASLALISALIAVDLLPNGLFNYLPFFFAGAVHGVSHGMAKSAENERRAARAAKAEAARTKRASRPPASPAAAR